MDVLITVDVEAHRVPAEITGAKSDSLGDILAAFKSVGLRATFFVDLCEVRTWGSSFMHRVCRRILDSGQDLQLHAHPHHFTGDSSRWLLSEYTRAEQAAVLDFAISQYVNFVGAPPLAFRAGGFGANADTLELLRERGVSIDCSLMRGWPGCDLPEGTPGVPSIISAIREIPLTPVTVLGTRNRPLRTMAIDFNWLPLFALKRILGSLSKADAPLITILMHSSSLCMRLGSQKFPYRRARLKKLVTLLSFLQEQGYGTVSVDQLVDSRMWEERLAPEVSYTEKSFIHQYVNLFYRSCIGASFKPKFAIFLGANGLALGLLAFLVRRWVG
jgi:peptidoglycan/xylan/chitin deacetylase (PgdA/CDA1 family)